jgi:hypothetical protein
VPLGDEEIEEETSDLGGLHGENIERLAPIRYRLSTDGFSG